MYPDPIIQETTQRRCYCPDDCSCHNPYRLTLCGCKAHSNDQQPDVGSRWYAFGRQVEVVDVFTHAGELHVRERDVRTKAKLIPGGQAMEHEATPVYVENGPLDRVSLVRIDNEWHAFTDTRAAWDFYAEWSQYRDCEFVGEVPIDVDSI